MYDNELKQVVLNIIKNSEDALLDNGIENPYIKIKTFTDNNNYVLEVSDNAGGISEDIIDNIFDPYFSTKTKKDGTGLGLYMSKIIIEEHCDGKLSVRNSDVGAIFRIELEQEKLSD
jgi:C4-dicarboxylate-specific signal transduction histidine kinase